MGSSVDAIVAQIDARKIEYNSKFFADTTASRLELEVILWAFKTTLQTHKSQISKNTSISLFTDSATASGLEARRAKLEASAYVSKRSKTELSNADLYREIFYYYDQLDLSINWIKGHTKQGGRSSVESVFACVDVEARRILRASLSGEKN